MKKLQVAILESNPAILPLLQKWYTSVFTRIGYTPHFTVHADQNLAIDDLRQNERHVFVSDLTLGNRKTFNGLDLLNRLRIEFPDILLIGNTLADLSHRVAATKSPTFHMFVDKQRAISGDAKYIEHTGAEVSRNFARNTLLERPRCIGFKPDDLVLGQSFLSLLQQVTFTTHNYDAELSISNVILEQLSGGRSGSRVYKLLAEAANGRFALVPTVLKISKRQNAEKERNNYKDFVQWVIPYHWRPELVGFGSTKDWGAVLYSFVIPPKRKFQSLTWFIEKAMVDHLLFAIDEIFSAKNQTWYSAELQHTESRNLNHRYHEKYFGDHDIVHVANARLVEAVSGRVTVRPTDSYLTVCGEKFPIPVDTVFGRSFDDFRSCIQHGDLNSNNVIVSEDKTSLSFIDFQDTGRGHVFEDFVCFEQSIRLGLQADLGSAEDILAGETALNEGRAPSIPYFQAIKRVRDHAFENFGEDYPSYLYGISAFGLRLMRLNGITEEARFRVAASVLAACKKLEELR